MGIKSRLANGTYTGLGGAGIDGSIGGGSGVSTSSTATVPTSPFLSDMLLWLESDYGITESGGVISQWDDRSGNSNHAVQTNIAKKPDVGANQAGKPTVAFDGASDYMTFTSLITTIREAFFVVTHSESVFANYAPIIGDVVNTGVRPNFHGSGPGGAWPIENWFFGAAGGGSADVYNGNGWVNGTSTAPTLFTKSETFKCYTIETLANTIAGTIAVDSPGAPTRLWNGRYAAILLYSAVLTQDQREQTEGYLRNRWATA